MTDEIHVARVIIDRETKRADAAEAVSKKWKEQAEGFGSALEHRRLQILELEREVANLERNALATARADAIEPETFRGYLRFVRARARGSAVVAVDVQAFDAVEAWLERNKLHLPPVPDSDVVAVLATALDGGVLWPPMLKHARGFLDLFRAWIA